jgi:hypothetical protein
MTGRAPLLDPPKQMVQLGFARFLETTVRIDEKLALLSLAQWLESQKGFTLQAYLENNLGYPLVVQGRGTAFEDIVTYYLYITFQKPTRLDKILDFVKPAPEWSTQEAHLVTFTKGASGELEWSEGSLPDHRSQAISRMAVDTVKKVDGRAREFVLEWLNDQQYVPILLPDNHMGPDQSALLKLQDGRLLWSAFQEKCCQTLSSTALNSAIYSVTPPFYTTENDKVCECSFDPILSH